MRKRLDEYKGLISEMNKILGKTLRVLRTIALIVYIFIFFFENVHDCYPPPHIGEHVEEAEI